VLTLSIPVAAEAKPRKVKVQHVSSMNKSQIGSSQGTDART